MPAVPLPYTIISSGLIAAFVFTSYYHGFMGTSVSHPRASETPVADLRSNAL
ncbi:hypothetical protein M427DRAFT_50370 [Gonapodya prolifera JEL478]|uniref:Uncharacterized protein n=1 Tax=Gonapodya prolifera (strain JEL478) TaxID=1344416 RepID=A0A139AZ29_GONPJ|nr:hypothetical protein M427DRAFT_50370 [Gonapodya prolifera JEL478]|eukprot:KXS22008.1 hypothetical protein M427DRAFT_50370 [Gonapodya prolifera JEL478]